MPSPIGLEQPSFESDRLAERRALQAQPAEIGGMLRRRACDRAGRARSATTPQPTPQYGQVVFTSPRVISVGSSGRRLAQHSARGRPRPCTSCARTQPLSGATASPLSSSMTKLCSGQVTAYVHDALAQRPAAMRAAVVEREIGVVGGAEHRDRARRRRTTRAPSRGMSSAAPMSIQPVMRPPVPPSARIHGGRRRAARSAQGSLCANCCE